MIPVPNTPLVLRRLEERDIPALHRFKNDPTVRSLLVGFSRGYSLKDLEHWLEFHRTRDNEVLFAVSMADEGSMCIGHVGLYEIDFRVRTAQFGILLGDPSTRNKGWGTAVSRTMLGYGFDELNLNKITGQYLTTNERVRRMNLRLGFKDEGILREEVYRAGRYADLGIMSVLRREWYSVGD